MRRPRRRDGSLPEALAAPLDVVAAALLALLLAGLSACGSHADDGRRVRDDAPGLRSSPSPGPTAQVRLP